MEMTPLDAADLTRDDWELDRLLFTLAGDGLEEVEGDERESAQAHAAEALGHVLAYHDQERVELALVHALNHSSPQVRCRAAWALGRHYDPNPPTITALTGRLYDGEESVRAEAAESLGRFGRLAAVSEPDLSRMATSDCSPLVRRWAAWAAARVSGSTAETARALASTLGNLKEESGVRREAAEALGHLGVAEESILSALRAASSDSDDLVACYAGEALSRLVNELSHGQAVELAADGDDVPSVG